MIRLIFLMFAAHALCDYPLQGDFLAKGKNRHTPIPGMAWWQLLTAHALIQAGAVYLITGSLALGLAELVIHWFTDWAKCEKYIDFNQDQAIHYGCKVLWAILVVYEGRFL